MPATLTASPRFPGFTAQAVGGVGRIEFYATGNQEQRAEVTGGAEPTPWSLEAYVAF